MRKPYTAGSSSSSTDAGAVGFVEELPVAPEGTDPLNVYVVDLPLSFSKEQFQALYEPFGNLVTSTVLSDPATNVSRGIGFARYSNRENAARALKETQGMMLPGATKPLLVRFAKDSSRKYEEQTAASLATLSQYAQHPPHPVYPTQYYQPQGYSAYPPAAAANAPAAARRCDCRWCWRLPYVVRRIQCWCTSGRSCRRCSPATAVGCVLRLLLRGRRPRASGSVWFSSRALSCQCLCSLSLPTSLRPWGRRLPVRFCCVPLSVPALPGRCLPFLLLSLSASATAPPRPRTVPLHPSTLPSGRCPTRQQTSPVLTSVRSSSWLDAGDAESLTLHPPLRSRRGSSFIAEV